MTNHAHHRADAAGAPCDATALMDTTRADQHELAREVQDVREAPVRTARKAVQSGSSCVYITTGAARGRTTDRRCQDGRVLGPVRQKICRRVRATAALERF
jgi:hypothetical protein